jgi:hypothetical protein
MTTPLTPVAIPADFNRPRWWMDPRALLLTYILIPAAITALQVWVKPDSINNFLIFRTSFDNLLQGLDLYAPYPDKHHDLYKYSPTFALFMGPFRALPIGFALLAWHLCNSLVLFWAVRSLKLTDRGKAFTLLFILPLLWGALQNTQSNGLMAGLMLGVLASLERRRIALAALLVCLGFYVKIFGAAAAILFLCYDRKLSFIVWCAALGLLLGLLPLPIAGYDSLMSQYQSWLALLRTDSSHEMNLSVATVIERWFGSAPPNVAVLIPAFILLILPLARAEVRRAAPFRLLYGGSLLIWVVIFNHKAESPTYIIAVTGVALWGLIEPPSRARTILLTITFILTGLSHGDLFPRYVRDEIVWRYGLKAVPSIVVWGLITYRLLACRESSPSTRYLTPAVPPISVAGTNATAPLA